MQEEKEEKNSLKCWNANNKFEKNASIDLTLACECLSVSNLGRIKRKTSEALLRDSLSLYKVSDCAAPSMEINVNYFKFTICKIYKLSDYHVMSSIFIFIIDKKLLNHLSNTVYVEDKKKIKLSYKFFQ